MLFTIFYQQIIVLVNSLKFLDYYAQTLARWKIYLNNIKSFHKKIFCHITSIRCIVGSKVQVEHANASTHFELDCILNMICNSISTLMDCSFSDIVDTSFHHRIKFRYFLENDYCTLNMNKYKAREAWSKIHFKLFQMSQRLKLVFQISITIDSITS